VLDDEGYHVQTVNDGQQALAVMAAHPPDLLLSDVMMPELDGLALTRRLRDPGDQTPVVLMSAVTTHVDNPGVHFLPKSFDLDHLVRVIEGVLEESSA
jgi:two-component system response regulator MprA